MNIKKAILNLLIILSITLSCVILGIGYFYVFENTGIIQNIHFVLKIFIIITLVLSYIEFSIGYGYVFLTNGVLKRTINEHNPFVTYFMRNGYYHVYGILSYIIKQLVSREWYGISTLIKKMGDYKNDSKSLVFFLSFMYFPLAIFSIIEILFRMLFGIPGILFLTALHSFVVLFCRLIIKIFIIVLK